MRKELNKVVLNHFQSHHNTVFEFTPGLNVITGQSDMGKSSLFRAIKWVVRNSPDGSGFITTGFNEMSVIMSFNDGVEVERFKGNRKNYYLLREPGAEERMYEKFGKNVPDDIVEACGMPVIKLARTKMIINLAEQFDPAFMLMFPPTQRAEILGQIAGTEIVDLAMVNVSSNVRSNKAARVITSEEVAELEETLKNYENLQAIKGMIDKAEPNMKKCVDSLLNIKAMRKFYDKFMEQTAAMVEIQKHILLLSASEMHFMTMAALLKDFNNIEYIAGIARSMDSKYNELKILQKIIEKTDKIETYVNAVRKLIETNNELSLLTVTVGMMNEAKTKENSIKVFMTYMSDIEDAGTELRNILKDLSSYEKIKEANRFFGFANQNYIAISEQMDITKNNMNDAIEEYKDALIDRGQCPTCFSDIDKYTVTNIAANL